MGLPMVKRLLSRGHSVTAYDIVAEKTRAAQAAGAKPAQSPGEAATGVEVVLLNLPTTQAVEQAVFGEGGVASAVKPPQVVMDFSTIKVDKGKAFADKLKAKTGCGWVDAPVSGGPPAAGSGTLTIMAGGEAADIARVQPLMADIAGRFTHMGPPGSGLVAKMINQLIVGCGHAVMAEALVLAEAAGIDAARVPECLAGGHADGSLLQKLYPRMVKRDFAPQGYARQLLKDLEMVNEFAGALKAPAPMMGEALSLYRMLVHRGHSELDTAAIFKLYEKEGK
ncbi:MAG: 3-hydroxyisobutyrate dehydrogenase [Betaproteobacteria bacterium]|jgi:3-hydroxyisobutyrate dehydrogenase-like beta-hydroxyacid dehydrogenase|nr:3-hydroxyisobutyrate dehydrogenase [Betaproteobacteria bacterium]